MGAPQAGRGKGAVPPGYVEKYVCVAKNCRFIADANHGMRMQHGRIHAGNGGHVHPISVKGTPVQMPPVFGPNNALICNNIGSLSPLI